MGRRKIYVEQNRDHIARLDEEPIDPPQESEPVCITGSKGADGAPGTAGRGVVSITPLYAMSQDKTTAP